MELTLKGVKPGDTLKLDWTDNRGAKQQDSAQVGSA